MGRTDDLRAKLLAKFHANKPDALGERFITRLNDHLEATHNVFVYSSNPWAFDLYQRSTGVPESDLPAWIAAQTAGQFKSVDKPPVWVNETDWCFHDDVPLVFVAQCADTQSGHAIYLFKGECDFVDATGAVLGKREFFRLKMQDAEGLIHTDGIIKA